MSRREWDKWICILLFISRAAFLTPYLLISTQVTFIYIPESETLICNLIVTRMAPLHSWRSVVEFLADIYVTALIIWLSYVITIDAEIVHAIEGKGQKNELLVQTSILSFSDQTYSQIIDNDRIIVVSFFELASIVMGDEDDDNDENYERMMRILKIMTEKSMAY
ncbi:hypothetical protein RhiirA1_464606 [Rhizophagus irregularis]|uniref:Uncharacterized protein n=1 Tax=Rhizophagus irregularis TaxID=588596 RepID=A0A2I1DVH5_9GLOM|nr:hypothetical protein RhiirA1_464606 [Rhizophagus irregularis]PKY13877.1 hypothetical protein RhiirB3_425765 [Rhizophagus irregularis]